MPKTAVLMKAVSISLGLAAMLGAAGASQAGQSGAVLSAAVGLGLGILFSLVYVPSHLLSLEEVHLYENGFQARLQNTATRMHYSAIVTVVAHEYLPGGPDPLGSARRFALYTDGGKILQLSKDLVTGLKEARQLAEKASFHATNSAVKELSAGHGYESPLGGTLTKKAAHIKERIIPFRSIVEHNGMHVAVRVDEKNQDVRLATSQGMDLVFVALLEKLIAHHKAR